MKSIVTNIRKNNSIFKNKKYIESIHKKHEINKLAKNFYIISFKILNYLTNRTELRFV